ncbi:hypothetical protein ACJZ2D_006653 [Fusarium nematophilum]
MNLGFHRRHIDAPFVVPPCTVGEADGSGSRFETIRKTPAARLSKPLDIDREPGTVWVQGEHRRSRAAWAIVTRALGSRGIQRSTLENDLDGGLNPHHGERLTAEFHGISLLIL